MLNTANETLTVCTKWFGPTAPFVSGGAYCTVNVPAGPTKPWPIPSNALVVAGAAVLTEDCTAVSAAPAVTCGKPRSGFSFFGFAGSVLSLFGAMEASGGETSCLLGAMTVVPDSSLSLAAATPGSVIVSASAQTKMTAKLRIPLFSLMDRTRAQATL